MKRSKKGEEEIYNTCNKVLDELIEQRPKQFLQSIKGDLIGNLKNYVSGHNSFVPDMLAKYFIERPKDKYEILKICVEAIRVYSSYTNTRTRKRKAGTELEKQNVQVVSGENLFETHKQRIPQARLHQATLNEKETKDLRDACSKFLHSEFNKTVSEKEIEKIRDKTLENIRDYLNPLIKIKPDMERLLSNVLTNLSQKSAAVIDFCEQYIPSYVPRDWNYKIQNDKAVIVKTTFSEGRQSTPSTPEQESLNEDSEDLLQFVPSNQVNKDFTFENLSQSTENLASPENLFPSRSITPQYRASLNSSSQTFFSLVPPGSLFEEINSSDNSASDLSVGWSPALFGDSNASLSLDKLDANLESADKLIEEWSFKKILPFN